MLTGMPHKVAKAMHTALALEITEDIGYPTPGSLGTYCGLERNLPTITWELQRGLKESEAWPWGRKAMLAYTSKLFGLKKSTLVVKTYQGLRFLRRLKAAMLPCGWMFSYIIIEHHGFLQRKNFKNEQGQPSSQ